MVVTASQTSRTVMLIGSPLWFVPPTKYISSIPSQLKGGPGMPGTILPMIPIMPRITAIMTRRLDILPHCFLDLIRRDRQTLRSHPAGTVLSHEHVILKTDSAEIII